MDLLDEALREAQRAARSRPPDADLARRQAAEKVWGYVASETNRLLRDAGLAVEPGHRANGQRRDWLSELDASLGLRLRERHDAFVELHGECFYEGNCPSPDTMTSMVGEARLFVEDLRAAIRARRGAAR